MQMKSDRLFYSRLINPIKSPIGQIARDSVEFAEPVVSGMGSKGNCNATPTGASTTIIGESSAVIGSGSNLLNAQIMSLC